ncbi:alpha/beta fold hydrolase [Croceicoccus sediminis]|uniref:alpha/beta fold hydrolase n=1 Tax=Croceicoccus sediminis TaxID=2571150 RepID=UPI001182F49D|nr:alpha/beta hydrolase [Croceicoccus sediminis]
MAEYRSHRFRSADGRLDLFARDYPATDGAGGGLPLLLMHGLTRNSADFEPLIPHLSGHRLIVPDQRGRGLSEYDDKSDQYRVDVYSGDMFALMADLDIDRFAIVGTSMGGLMGMIMGALAPAKVAALVLNDIGPVLEEGGLDRIRTYVGPNAPARDWKEAAARIASVNAEAFPDFTEEDWLAFARRTCREDATGVFSAYDPAIAKGLDPEDDAVVPADMWPVWKALDQMPVMAVRGGLSDLFSAETVAEMDRRHSGPFEAVTVPNRGHAPLLDEAEVLAAIGPFLQTYAR